jgi:hypothetical protein
MDGEGLRKSRSVPLHVPAISSQKLGASSSDQPNLPPSGVDSRASHHHGNLIVVDDQKVRLASTPDTIATLVQGSATAARAKNELNWWSFQNRRSFQNRTA